MKYLWLSVVFLFGCMSPVMRFGAGKSAKQAQHDTLDELTPGRLSLEKRFDGPVLEAKIRVYADDDYRAQNHRWQQTFDERLDYANGVLAAKFGVRLVADYREWNHHAPGDTLEQHLEELERLDAGSDVLVVVGLTSSQSLVSATFEQLGLATLSGRHMMLRGYADLEERNSYASAFADLSADERENALVTLRYHKTTSVFLHELGHILGADHEPTEDTIMNATYSRNARAFSDDALLTIQRALDQRLGRAAPEPRPSASLAAQPKAPHTLKVSVVAGGAMIDGKTLEPYEVSLKFSMEKLDTEIDITKGDGASPADVDEVVRRAKAVGLTNIKVQ